MLYVLYLIFIVMIVAGLILSKKLFNPLSIYNIIWFFVIFLYQFRLSRLQEPLVLSTINLFIISTLCFSISFIFVYCVKFNTKRRKIENGNIISKQRIKKVYRIWILIEFLEIIYSKGFPILWILTGSSKTYMNFGIPTLHGLMNSIGLVLVTLSFYNFLISNNQKEKKEYTYIILTILLFYLCLITRQVIISAVIQMIVVYIFLNRRVPYFKILKLMFIGIIAFGILGNIRTGYDNFISVSLIETSISSTFIGFYWVYMYLTMTVANINNAVLLGINHYGGLYNVVRAFLPSVFSDFLFSNSSVYVPNYLVTNAYNVSGYYINFYIGLGNFGVYIISAIYGILGAIISKKAYKNNNQKNILYYSVYMQIIILSFFYNHLLYLPSGFQFIVIYILFRCKTKEGGGNNERKESFNYYS